MSRVLPILFNTDMVRAILIGRKTVTRRIVKRNVDAILNSPYHKVHPETPDKALIEKLCCPPYQPGDILYVREAWTNDKLIFGKNVVSNYHYKADGKMKFFDSVGREVDFKWKPSIHMPKEAARIWLKVTDVGVERLQEITEIETEEEGFKFTPPCLHKVSYESYCDLDGPCTSSIKYCDMSAGELFGKILWNSTIKKSDLDRYGWDANPWVWKIEFERCEKPKGELCEEN